MADAELGDGNQQSAGADTGKQGSGILKVVGIGCLIMVVLMAIATIFVWVNWRSWTGKAVRTGIDAYVEELELSEVQDQRVEQVIDRLIVGFEEERVSWEQIKQIMNEFSHTPGFIIVPISVFGGQYIDPSGLTAEEKEAAWLTTERYARGISEGAIDKDNMTKIGLPLEQNGNSLKTRSLTDEELRAVLGRMKEEADAVDIANESYEVDVAGSLEESVTKVLGEGWDVRGQNTPAE